MARLIDADALMEETVWKCGGDPYDQYYMGYQDALDNVEATIDAQDTVDAVEVVHGRWIRKPFGKYTGVDEVCCSICAFFIGVVDSDTGFREAIEDLNYCPNCGARMGLEVKDG